MQYKIVESLDQSHWKCTLISFQVEWQANGIALARSSKIEIDEDDSHSTLRIRDMAPEDAGAYRIKISNKAGADSAAFDVSVKGEWNGTI